MLKLYSRKNKPLSNILITEEVITKITTDATLPLAARHDLTLLINQQVSEVPEGFLLVVICGNNNNLTTSVPNVLFLDDNLSYISTDDIIKFNPDTLGIQVLYRNEANANSILLTERCNSFCIMCSQPPRDVNDSFIVSDVIKMLPLINKSAHEIGFTGGEPTLLGNDLIKLIQLSKQHLPNTSLHILSNGKNFHDLEMAIKVSEVNHHDLMWGIPLYSDIPQLHDFVVQSEGAFDKTIKGILNLKRCQQRVELRVVIHQQTYKRLSELARFICRNLLFVDHVALMGLEHMGFAKANMEELWVDPYNYKEQLETAVNILAENRIRVSIYNHQLCVIPETIRKFAVKSISDWKNEYLPECSDCSKKSECGGFFSSTTEKHSEYISAIKI